MKLICKYTLIALLIVVLSVFPVYAQNTKTVNFTNSYTVSPVGPTLAVQVLKYEPYPVNAGDWFDMWVKVQNVGQADAKNVVFTLQPAYPFSSDDALVRNYGIIFGTINAYSVDQKNSANEVILKYRVKKI